MKPEEQVCSQELSEKLKILGVNDLIKNKESYFVWVQETPKRKIDNPEWHIRKSEDWKLENMFDWCFALTVSELGEILPWNCYTNKVGNEKVMRDCGKFVAYFEPGDPAPAGAYNKIYAETEADARAKMLIYLIENKLI